MRNLLIAVGVVLVLIVGAVIAVPSLVGTEQMTAFLTERLRSSTGYNVAIRGPVALSVLPSPRLSVRDIHVTKGSAPDAPELAKAASVDVSVALLPLIQGKVEVTAVTLRDPVVTIEGPVEAAKPVEQAPPKPGAPAAAPPPDAAAPAAGSSKFSVAVRHVVLTNGSVLYRRDGRAYQIDHLDLDLTTAPDGAISGTADSAFNNDKLHLTGSLGAVDCAKAIPLSLHATTGQGGGQLDFDGTAGCENGQPAKASGKLKLAAGSVSAVLAPFAKRALPPALDKKLALDGTLNASASKADLSDLTLDLDQTHGVGSVAATMGDRVGLDVAIDFNRIDLDAWLAKRAAVTSPVKAADAAGAMAPGAGQRPWPAFVDLHVGLDLSAELLTLHGGLIRQARLNGVIDHGTATINQATAELPGGTDLNVSGQIADPFTSARFAGTIDAETDNLRTLAGWAGIKLDWLPPDRFRQASLSTSLDLSAAQAGISRLDLDLDGSRFKGAANLTLGDRPAIGLRLIGDQLNLDAYGASDPASVLPAAGALLPLVAANLDITLNSVTWRGQLLKAVHLAAAIDDGGVTVREARIGDLAGGSVTLAGRLSGGLGPDSSVSGQLTAVGADAMPLLALAGLGGEEFAGRLGAYQFDARLDGPLSAPTVDVGLTAQDGRLAAQGTLGFADGPHFAGNVTLDHPEAARLAAFLFPTYRPAGGTLGAFSLTGRLDLGPARAMLDEASVAIGGQKLGGTVTIDGLGPHPMVTADLTGEDLVVDPFLPVHEVAWLRPPVQFAAAGAPGPVPGRWSQEKLDFGWLTLLDADVKLTAGSIAAGQWHFDKPALAALLKSGTLTIAKLTGGLLGGAIDAHGSLQQAAVPLVAVTMAGINIDLKDLAQHLGSAVLTAGTGGLNADLKASGSSPAEWVGSLGGTAALKARNGVATGFDLGAITDRLKTLKSAQDLVGVAQVVQAGGATRFSALDGTATIANGVARCTDLHLVADGGDLTGTATADLPAWTVDGRAQFTLAGRSDLPPLAMTFSGPLDNPEKRIDTRTLAAFVERQGLGQVLKGLTGQPQASPAQPSQQQQKPAQQLRDILKGLVPNP